MYVENDQGQFVNEQGKIIEPKPLEESINFIDGLADDAINNFAPKDALLQLLYSQEHQEDAPDNIRKLKEPLATYYEYFNHKYGQELVEKIRQHSLEDSVDKFDQAVGDFNQAVSEVPLDFDKIAEILDRAFALFGR